MTTARDLIEDAAAEIGEDAADTSLSDHDAQRMLRRLRRMLDGWATERLMVYALTQETIALVAGTASYSSSGLAAGRPVKVEGAFVRDGDTDYGLTIVTDDEYQRIPAKTTQSMPEVLYPRMSMPNATLYLWPVPTAAYTLYLTLRRTFGSVAGLSTTVDLPPGYERAIVTNLAVECAPLFGTKVSDETATIARDSKAALKCLNYAPAEMDHGIPSARYPANRVTIYEG